MTSVAKGRTRLRRIYPNQNHNKHHTPGIIINYLIFYCIHILFCIHILSLCDYIFFILLYIQLSCFLLNTYSFLYTYTFIM